ncbi:pentapeptide repeat-containing protein [Sphaerisporangium album]|uniref:pentapeptide repeat-containing protein n=1 Tax=Sphaerisporangium album TaxID=509200 RepID=UPI0015F08987|nr:pentapeptide repeat-containing protein [Sphaerisporangium album]
MEASFVGAALFGQAKLGVAAFNDASFSGPAIFWEATFAGDAWFTGATFAHGAGFEAAVFTRNASFREATFSGDAEFSGTVFSREAHFDGATFAEDAWFGEAINIRVAGVDAETRLAGARTTAFVSAGQAHVPAARFDGTLSFEGARVTDPKRAHAWPPRGEPNPTQTTPPDPTSSTPAARGDIDLPPRCHELRWYAAHHDQSVAFTLEGRGAAEPPGEALQDPASGGLVGLGSKVALRPRGQAAVCRIGLLEQANHLS